jgi:hypothetical protein
MTKHRPSIQCYDDEWITIAWVGQHEQCCLCGTKHRVDYRVIDGKLQFKGHMLPNRGKPK